MIVFDAPVSPADLTVFVRSVPTPSNLILSALFPETTRPENTVNFTEITKTNRTARFRSFDGRIHVADRDGGSDRVVKLPALSDSRNKGEYERLQQEMARLGGTRTEALSTAVYDDAQDLVSYIRNRQELAIADLLVDGILTVDENGFTAEYDYGVAAGNKPTAGTAWSNHATATALSDLIAWADAYEAATGERPASVLTSRSAVRHFQQNTELINAVKGAQTGVTRVSLADAAGVLEDEGLPTNWVVDETNLDVDGTTTRVWPVDKLSFLPANPGDLLEVRYGLTATALELVNSNEVDMSFEDAPGIVGVVEKQGPPYREFTFVDATGMPIVKDAKKVFTADVL
jgi:hypothetical protein